MKCTVNVAHTGWQQSSCGPQAVYTSWLPLLGLLHKISWLALYLLLIRICSAAGFVVALWLCPVQVFAKLGIYLASINLASLAVFGRYELLVVAAHDERKCADAVHLCTITAACAIVAALLISIIFNQIFITHEPLAKPPAEYGPRSLFARDGVVLGLLSWISLPI